VFSALSHFHPSLSFAGKSGCKELKSNSGVIANIIIRLRGEWLTVSSTLAYNDVAIITAVKNVLWASVANCRDFYSVVTAIESRAWTCSHVFSKCKSNRTLFEWSIFLEDTTKDVYNTLTVVSYN